MDAPGTYSVKRAEKPASALRQLRQSTPLLAADGLEADLRGQRE